MAAEMTRIDNQREEFTEEDPLREPNPDEGKEEEEVKRTCVEQCIYVFRNITVEPSLLMFIVAIMLSTTATQNLNLEKACRVNLQYPENICDALREQSLESQNEYERETQRLLASAMSWKTYLSATIPCVLALFAGSFSDKTGHRKFLMGVSVFGQFLAAINYIINVYFFHQLNLQVLVFTDALIEGLSGGWCLCFLAGFAFISSITTDKNRTFRLGLVNFNVTVAFPIGMGVSGPLLRALGYYGCYGITASMHVLNLMYIIFVLKDPPRNQEQKKHDGKGVFHYVRTFFDVANVKDTMRVLYRKAPNNRRLHMCILLAVICVLFGPMYGEVAIMYMTTRYRFNWDEVQFSMFQTYNFVTHTIGTIFSILVLSKYLQWHDSLLGIISTVSKIAASFVYAFAANATIFYIAPMVEILNGTSLLAMRSILSKLVEPNELGSINSLIGLTENLMPLIYVPLYTTVYSATMEVLPGAVFLIGAGLTLPAVCVLSYLFYEHRKQLGKSKEDTNGHHQS